MRLIPISANVMVNPDCISCIEQRNMGGVSGMYVWIEDRDYVLTIPFDEFMKSIRETEPMIQQFAG